MTVEEALKQSGMTDEQIKALDAKAISGFTTILTTASAAEAKAVADREAAELARRAQQDMYKNEIAPALDQWASDKANLEATTEFYRKQNESARANGFVPKDAPGYTAPTAPAQPRGGNGEFVAGPTGSPQFLSASDGIKALSNARWTDNEYFRLFRDVPPDDFETLMNEAVASHLPYRDYVAKKYGFEAKRSELTAARQKEHDDAIRKETTESVNKSWSERTGQNPNVRVAASSQFADVAKATAAGTRKDPLTMNREQRHEQTRQNIQKELTDNAAATVQ